MSTSIPKIIQLTKDNLDLEHICCGFAEEKLARGTQQKKKLIRARLDEGFHFKKFDVRGKVFIEYGPADTAWSPVEAPGFTIIGCFWVSGRFKGQGYGRLLLEECFKDSQNSRGVVCVTSAKKRPFLTDKGFFIKHGFTVCDTAPPYFELLVKKNLEGPLPYFRKNAKKAALDNRKGLTFVFSDLCPFSEYWVEILTKKARELNMAVQMEKITTLEQAKNAPSAFPVFSLFRDGRFLTHKIPTQKEFLRLIQD